MISVLMFVACLYPLVLWVGLGLTGGLSANPPEYLIRSSGEWALVVLCLVLLATPLNRYARISVLLMHRRMLGLFAYFYSALHLLGWALWEQAFLLDAMWHDVVTRWFITVGVLAFVLLTPLALTSTSGWMRRLGRNWKRLHYAIYAAIFLSVWHFWLVRAGKNDFFEVWVYAGVIVLLCLPRLIQLTRLRCLFRAGKASPKHKVL
jgi:sulfoxide reductase heme-binding subunit YedZ